MNINIKTFLFIASLICATLFIAVSIPLTMEVISPNKFYGIRIDEAYSSEEAWYAVNRYGGWALITASIVMIALNVLLYLFRKKVKTVNYTVIFLTIMIICILVAAGITTAYASNVIEEQRTELNQQT